MPGNQNQLLENGKSEDISKVKLDNSIKIEADSSDQIEVAEQLSKDDLTILSQKIEELEKKCKLFRRKREELNTKVAEKTKLRNEKNNEVRELITKAKEEKEKRNEINKRINELKNQKLAITAVIQKYKEIVDQADQKLEVVEDSKTKTVIDHRPKNLHFILKKYSNELKHLEWRLQTETFTIDEERRIVDRIADLDDKYTKLARVNNLGREKIKAYNKLRKNRKKLRYIIRELRYSVKEGRIHHKEMINSYSAVNIIRKEADSVHNEVLKTKKEADEIHKKYIQSIKEKKRVIVKISKHRKLSRRKGLARKERSKKAQATKALERTKDGKKITFDDFKSLIDRGMI